MILTVSLPHNSTLMKQGVSAQDDSGKPLSKKELLTKVKFLL